MKKLRIGIPRAFYYYLYPGLWETFFRALGMETVISEHSTKKTIEIAATVSESEHCLPHKIFDAHLTSLLEKVDAVFIPRILSMKKDHIACPKFGALPDASRTFITENITLISMDINVTREPLEKTLMTLGRRLGAPKKTVRSAVDLAFTVMNDRHIRECRKAPLPASGGFADKKILLLGHPYTLHDAFIGPPVIRKLKSLYENVEVMTFTDENIASSDILWCTFNKMYQKLLTLSMVEYAGVVQICTFNCGADSMMTERFRRLCIKKQIPYLLLMIDEHTAQAGMDTRLEAFVDSLSWRARRAPSKKENV
jgi:predicted nucleotide-binding protein (sugar kinase/HSP70/actin superfamily)